MERPTYLGGVLANEILRDFAGYRIFRRITEFLRENSSKFSQDDRIANRNILHVQDSYPALEGLRMAYFATDFATDFAAQDKLKLFHNQHHTTSKHEYSYSTK